MNPLRGLGGLYRRHVWRATVLLVALVLVAGLGIMQLVTRDRVGGDVAVAGVELQGLTRAQAQAKLARVLGPRVASVTLRTPKGVRSVTLAGLGLRLDTAASAEAAVAAGRHRLLGLSLWLPSPGRRTLPAVLAVDAAAYRKGLAAVEKDVAVPATDATLRLDGQQVGVRPARDGVAVDAVALRRLIAAAVARGRAYDGPVPTAAVTPAVSTAQAQALAGQAESYLARPLVLRLRAKRVELTRAQVAGMLSVNTGADAADYPLTFDNARARATLHRLFASCERPAVDATITVHAAGGITVTQSHSGEAIDMGTLVADLDDAAVGNSPHTVFVALERVEPALSTEDVETTGLATLGAQFVTYFDPRNTSRATNIALAAKLVDGTVVRPGATFSMNQTVGPRTTNRGFDYAPVIAADDVLRQGVGGGVCQYATTLFNAALLAGLPIVERHPHEFYISHYPAGRDATVSYGSADLRFRNDTGKAIVIRSWVDDDHLTVALVGKTGRTATFTTSPFTDVTKPSHGRSAPRVIYDPDLASGMIRWEKGVDGRTVKVVRTVRDASGKVLFRDTFVSRYEPMDWVKRVGTGG